MNSKKHVQPDDEQAGQKSASEISHLERREIQAPVAECLINGFAKVVGRDKAIEIATEAIRADAIVSGEQMAETFGDNSMKTLGRVVREVWAEGDALTIEFVEETEQELSFNVTRCRYAEFYTNTGRKDLGYCLSCSRDDAFVRGFNPQISLSRTQTIMQGATTCDFQFTLAEDRMNKPPHNLTMRHPTVDEGQIVLDLMIACDIAQYGEPDSSLDDLLYDWTLVDLNEDAWLVFTPEDKLVGYAIVFKDNTNFSFDFYTHPDDTGKELRDYLLTQCQSRVCALLADTGETEGTATTIISQVSKADRHVLEPAGFEPKKYYFRMLIELDTLPSAPVWPEGCTLRTVVAGQDDQMLYNFIQTAFEQPGRTPPSFESWHDFMMRADHFEGNLWFLLFNGDELIGAALCYNYPEFGWVRQLAVASFRRRQGVGSALLRHVFRAFFERGHKAVALAVDSKRPNAQSLYENVGMKCVRRHDEYQRKVSI